MNTTKKYVYLVNPGTFAGSPFLTTLEVEGLVEVPTVSEEHAVKEEVNALNRNWIQSVVRLPKAAQKMVRESVWSRAAKVFGSAA